MTYLKKISLFCFLTFFLGCQVGRPLNKFDLNKIEFDENTYPVVIIGGGIAGLTSAIYTSQANIKCLLLEGKKVGGALAQSHSVRNWPGEENIPGIKLVEKIKNHAINSGVQIAEQIALSVDFSVWPYSIKIKELTGNQNTKTIKALSSIIAMGATPNYLNIPGEQEYFGKGVSTCAVCDGPLYKNKIVGIVGGGNAAIEEASYLSGIAKKVYIFVRRDKFRAVGKIKDEIISRPNVEVMHNTNVIKVKGNNKKLTEVVLLNNKTDEKKNLKLDGLFLAIGAKPNTQIFKGKLQLDKSGYIVLRKDQRTSKKGIFAAGDIADPDYKQAIASAGTGCIAAIQAQKFLDKIGFDPLKYNQPFDTLAPQALKADEEKKEIKQTKKTKKKKGQLVIEINNLDEFKSEVLQSDIPVVVDFFATWCIPCQQMLPVFMQVANEFEEKVKFVKLNINKNMEIATELDIYSVPTFMFLKDGKEVERIIGGMPKDAFRGKVREIFKD